MATKVVTSVNITPQPDKTINIHQDLGTFVTDVKILQYLKSKEIRFEANGLKPNTRVWPYFGGVPVSANCRPNINSNFGAALVTDSTGYITGIFVIPSNTFKADTVEFLLVDVDDLITGRDVISTRAIATYYGNKLSLSVGNATVDVNIQVPVPPIIEVHYGDIPDPAPLTGVSPHTGVTPVTGVTPGTGTGTGTGTGVTPWVDPETGGTGGDSTGDWSTDTSTDTTEDDDTSEENTTDGDEE